MTTPQAPTDTGGEHIAGAAPSLRCDFDEDCQNLATCAWRTVDGRYFPACDDCSAKTSARYPITVLRDYVSEPTPAAPSTEVASGVSDCALCGYPKYRHSGGMPNTCPIIATYRPKPAPPASDVPPIASSGEVICPVCKAQPGEPCTVARGASTRVAIGMVMTGFHKERVPTALTPPAASSGQDLREAALAWVEENRLMFNRRGDHKGQRICETIAALLSAPAVQPGGDLVVGEQEFVNRLTEALLAAYRRMGGIARLARSGHGAAQIRNTAVLEAAAIYRTTLLSRSTLQSDFAALRRDYGRAALLINIMRERWEKVSQALNDIEGGMHADLEDAASEMATAMDDPKAVIAPATPQPEAEEGE